MKANRTEDGIYYWIKGKTLIARYGSSIEHMLYELYHEYSLIGSNQAEIDDHLSEFRRFRDAWVSENQKYAANYPRIADH